MKKIVTLLLAISSFTIVNAQSRKIEEARDVINGGSRTDDRRVEDRRVYDESVRYPERYPSGSRSAEADRISREYDHKIQSIRNNPNLNSEEKARIIRQLEKDRDQRIRSVNKGYEENYKKDKKYKSNNGKHKGWTKGKGNQKKYKGYDRNDD